MTRYTYSEPIVKNPNVNNRFLSVVENNRPLLKVFRLLSGTIICNDTFTQKKHRFKTNFFYLPYQDNVNLTQRTLLSNFEDEVPLSYLNKFFKISNQNNAFYFDIISEVTNCLVSMKKHDYLKSFIYLYRLLEGVSYSFPLLYTSKNFDYKKSYKELKSFFSEDSQAGELLFFKTFLKKTFGSEDFYNSTIDIDMIDIENEELRSSYYTIYKRHLRSEMINDSTQDIEIKINFPDFFSFIINVRNRYFHFLQGTNQSNLSSQEIPCPDMFFKPIVNQGLNAISIILFEIIKFEMERIDKFSSEV